LTRKTPNFATEMVKKAKISDHNINHTYHIYNIGI
jgi:hypothetical protein